MYMGAKDLHMANIGNRGRSPNTCKKNSLFTVCVYKRYVFMENLRREHIKVVTGAFGYYFTFLPSLS